MMLPVALLFMACNASNDAEAESAAGTDAADSKAVLEQAQWVNEYDGGATCMVTRLTLMGDFPVSGAKFTCVVPPDVLLGE